MTDAILNRLAREGVRVRTFALSPGAIVPCAVWDDDELMVLRLRGDFGGASEFTLSQRVAGTEVSRATGQIAASSHGEVIYAEPAAWIRQLPVVEVEVVLTAHEGGEERPVGSYTLVHGGTAAPVAGTRTIDTPWLESRRAPRTARLAPSAPRACPSPPRGRRPARR